MFVIGRRGEIEMAYITKIEVYPQIFFYDKVYLDERLII